MRLCLRTSSKINLETKFDFDCFPLIMTPTFNDSVFVSRYGQEFFSFCLERPDRIWGSPSPAFRGYRGPFPVLKRLGSETHH